MNSSAKVAPKVRTGTALAGRSDAAGACSRSFTRGPVSLMFVAALAGVGALRLVARMHASRAEAIRRAPSAANVSAETAGIPRHVTSLANHGVTRTAVPRQARAVTAIARLHAALQRMANADTEDPAAQDAALQDAQRAAGQGTPSELLASLTPAEVRTAVGTAALLTWLKQSPTDAAAWLRDHPWLTGDQAEAVGHALAVDPAALETIGSSLPAGALNDSIRAAAALTLADQAPVTAARVAQGLSSANARRDTLETVVYTWAVADPIAAEQYIASLDDRLLRQRLLVAGAKALASTDADLAVAWLTGGAPDLGATPEGLVTVAATWSAQSPDAAAAWIATLRPGEVRTQATDALIEHWGGRDPVAARAWIDAQPDRDAILTRLARADEERRRPKDE